MHQTFFSLKIQMLRSGRALDNKIEKKIGEVCLCSRFQRPKFSSSRLDLALFKRNGMLLRSLPANVVPSPIQNLKALILRDDDAGNDSTWICKKYPKITQTQHRNSKHHTHVSCYLYCNESRLARNLARGAQIELKKRMFLA